VKEDSEVLGLFLFHNQNSEWLGVHIGNFQEDGGKKLPSQEYFAHA
jgi:hypothetical protein